MITITFKEELNLFGKIYPADHVLDLAKEALIEDYYTGEVSKALRSGKIEASYDESMPIVNVRISPFEDYVYKDFSILGFSKESPLYSLGRKTQASYYLLDKLAVKKTFTDVMENGSLIAINCLFEFYNFKGELVDSKTEEVVKFSKDSAEEHMEKRRHRQFAYLRASVRGTPFEPYINIVFDYFKDGVDKYKESGNLQLVSDMEGLIAMDLSGLPAEQAQAIGQLQAILTTSVPRNDEPTLTIRVVDSIKYQMGEFELERIE